MKKTKKLKLDKSKVKKCFTKRKKYSRPKKSAKRGNTRRNDFSAHDNKINKTYDNQTSKVIEQQADVSIFDKSGKIGFVKTKKCAKKHIQNISKLLGGCNSTFHKMTHRKDNKSRNEVESNNYTSILSHKLSAHILYKPKPKNKISCLNINDGCKYSNHTDKPIFADYNEFYNNKLFAKKNSLAAHRFKPN